MADLSDTPRPVVEVNRISLSFKQVQAVRDV